MLGARFLLTVSHKYLRPLRGTLFSVPEVDAAPFLQAATFLSPAQKQRPPTGPRGPPAGGRAPAAPEGAPVPWGAAAFPRRWVAERPPAREPARHLRPAGCVGRTTSASPGGTCSLSLVSGGTSQGHTGV